MLRRTGLAFVGFLTLTGCSQGCDLKAVVIGGRLAFIVDPRSGHRPDCIDGIQVVADDAETVRATPGRRDQPGLVENGVFWWKNTAVGGCENPFPIAYGQKIAGKPFVYSDGTSNGVDAKPLRIGVIYEVTSSGRGTHGYGRFRIRADRRVENLPRPEPSPDASGNGS